MLDPRNWEYVDRLRLLIAVTFGAALGFTNGYSHGWFDILWALRTINDDEKKVRIYCYKNLDMTVLDAVKNVLGLDK
jgi:hypothetical protein